MSRLTMIRLLRHFLRDQSGATAIEYAIIAGGVAAAVAGAISVLGISVAAKWTAVSNAFH